jgi:hypothetical protein
MGWCELDGLDQDRDKLMALVNSVMNLRVRQNAEKLLSGSTTGGLSSSAQLHWVSSQITLPTELSGLQA